MATISQSMSVKSLNKSEGRKRFVFKSFGQRIEEIDIDVFRNLEAVKAEPSDGSSFLRDCLIEWRELNTAEDFISFYEEMLPWVQTLPQVLLHSETIMSKLLSRLKFEARLSLEPILELIAALSRDLLNDFLPFLQRIAVSVLCLLQSGADRDPEVVEQIFKSWSKIMMYLQKYLTRDVVHLLKITIDLRYNPKDYVRKFMTEAVSFVLRNATAEQLKKGIRRVVLEAVEDPSDVRISGASDLLWYVMRGGSSRLHSKAEQVLRFLLNSSIYGISDKPNQGSETVAEVVTATFGNLCEELPPKELTLMWDCLVNEISVCVGKESLLLHLTRLLSILVSTIRSSNRGTISDYQPMLDLVGMLIHKVIIPTGSVSTKTSDVFDRVLQLMLCLLDGVNSSNRSSLSSISLQWAPVFEVQNKSLVTFIKDLLKKDPSIPNAFQCHIISVICKMGKDPPPPSEEVIYLMLSFFKKLGDRLKSSKDGESKEELSRLGSFLRESICYWISLINNNQHGDPSTICFDETNLSLIWGAVTCYPHVSVAKENITLLMDLIDALDKLMTIDAGVRTHYCQSLVGAALGSYIKLQPSVESARAETSKVLDLAKKYRSSPQVLSAVAEFLDYTQGSTDQAYLSDKTFHPEFVAEKSRNAIMEFADNLYHPDKSVRISTLRMLCHYQPLDHHLSAKHQPPAQPCYQNMDYCNVTELLLSIESIPLSISTSRKVITLLSKIQMALSGGRISEAYLPLLLYGIIGVLHKRFEHLWEPAIQCLTVLIDKYIKLVWDILVCYLAKCQMEFLASDNKVERPDVESSSNSSDLVESFKSFLACDSDGTPRATVLSLLLRSLQKAQSVTEFRSRQLITLFFKFMGYPGDDIVSVGKFTSHACKVREWQVVLKEWLTLLNKMKNLKSLDQDQVLREILVNRVLDESDADVQMKVLDCLVNGKYDLLVQYEQHLKNLINSKSLREELATWSLSKESHHIEEMHRGFLIPVVVRLLIPKVRNLSANGARKQANVNHRKAVISFLGQLDAGELPLLFALLVKPLLPDSDQWFWSSYKSSLEEFQATSIIKHDIGEMWLNKRSGFLHVIEDILNCFDQLHIKPFLNLLMGLVGQILEACSLKLDKNNGPSHMEILSSDNLTVHETIGSMTSMTDTAAKKHKSQRSMCLKIISFVLDKYGEHDLGSEFWDMFFKSVKPLIDSFKQEASSSEQPSSLFSCFRAMSGSHTLVSYLGREETLVPSIFSILTVKTAKHPIISEVLKFTENLLNLDNDLDDCEDNPVRSVLKPNLETLICSLHGHFCRISVKRPGRMELKIFKLLLKYIEEPEAAKQFVDILLPFLGSGSKSSDNCLEVLLVMKEVLPIVGSGSTGEILKAVAPLLISAGLEVRQCICDILKSLAVNDTSVVSLAKLLSELNAVSPLEIDELDYETITKAYGTINPELFFTIGEDYALVILSHSMHDFSCDDFSLRQSAYGVLLAFVNFCAIILEGEAKKCEEFSEPGGAMETEVGWTKSRVETIVKNFILKHMGEAMDKDISIQREWIALLREMVLRLSRIPDLKPCRNLCSKDAEVDFFNNILHLQIYKRGRALIRFRDIIVAGEFPETITKKIFVPLFFKMMFDAKSGGKGEHIGDKCLESLVAISSRMRWNWYRSFLLGCFKEIKFKPDKRKILIRLISKVLDKFHFSTISSSVESKENPSEASDHGKIIFSSSNVLDRCTSSGDATEIQVSLQNTVFPQIQELLTADSENLEATISVAALKLLKLLPVDTMDSQLSSIIHRVSNFLKNRLESIRDDAREALYECLKVLGLEYLQYIVKVMRATLKRGYELHVLGYSLCYILSKAIPKPVVGRLDYCLEELFSVAENDILGDVAEEKEVDKIASKMKETRQIKSFETLTLIAQSVTFNSHALKLLSPVKAHLQKHLTPKKKAKLQKILSSIAAGIQRNPSVDQTDLFIFVIGLIEDGMAEKIQKNMDLVKENPNKQVSNGRGKKRDASDRIVGYESQSSHLITVFALEVLQNRLKSIYGNKKGNSSKKKSTKEKELVQEKDEELLSKLDPFVELLGNCLSSKYEDIISRALICLQSLVTKDLPSLRSQADKIKNLLLDIAQKSGSNTRSSLTDSCLILLKVLLSKTSITLSNDQLHMLIKFPLFVDLERNPSSVALSLLEAIVKRNLVVPEIYNLATEVQNMMVTSQDDFIRKKCRSIMLEFIRRYTFSEKRMQQHLDYLIKNLRYEHASGRESVLEMLHAIIVKNPKNVMDEQAPTIFIYFAERLANEEENKVSRMVGECIKELMKNANQHSLLLDYSLNWYLHGKQNIWSVGAQVLGFIVEVQTKGFRSHIETVLSKAESLLKSALQLDPSNEALDPLRKAAYHSLVMFKEMLNQFPDLYFKKDHEEIWKAISELLLYPSMKIRQISNSIVSAYFREASKVGRDKSKSMLLLTPSKLFAVAVSLCHQLEANVTDEASYVLTQNLVVVISHLNSLARQKISMDLREFWSSLELHEQSSFLKSFQLLGSRKGRIMLGFATSGVKDSTDEPAEKEHLQSLLVSPLLKKMGKMALQKDEIQMKIVFNCFKIISSDFGQEGCQQYATQILLPVYKVCEGFAGKIISDDVKQLAEEVRKSVQDIIGLERFLEIYNLIRKNMKTKRDKRKNQEKVMAVVNPMRNAKRKLRVAEKHKAHKKRKIMTMKTGRFGKFF